MQFKRAFKTQSRFTYSEGILIKLIIYNGSKSLSGRVNKSPKDFLPYNLQSSFSFIAAFIENVTNYRNILKFPTDEDLNGAAVALTRLQVTYNLETASLARGELNGVQYSSEMTVEECFELGRQMYLNRDFHHSILWMREAMDRLGRPQNKTVSTKREDILEYLAFSMYKEGNVNAALVMTNELLEIMPNHERAKGNKGYYEKELAEIKSTKTLRGDIGTMDVDEETIQVEASKAHAETVFKPDPKVYTDTERQLYEKLCRGEVKPSPIQLAPLRCRYVSLNNYYLKLGPLKMEEASLTPYIVVYHDVITDDEITTIQEMAKPRVSGENNHSFR